MKRIIITGIFLLILLLSCNSEFLNDEGHYPGNGGSGASSNDLVFSREEAINDMYLPHEGPLSGVPDYFGWSKKPTFGFCDKVPDGWNAIFAWGQVYADASMRNPDVDFPKVRVHLKDLQLYILRKNGVWELVQNSPTPGGDAYVEDYEDDVNKVVERRKEPGGGISVHAGSGFNFHFYPTSGKLTLADPTDISAVFVVCKARLIGTENYSVIPKYLVNVGGDYYRNREARWAPDYVNNDDIAIGRFKYVTPEWRYYFMHTFKKKADAEKVIFPLEN